MRQHPFSPDIRKPATDILFGLLVLFVGVAPIRADVNEGLQAYEIGDYREALVHLRTPAEQGDPKAQLYLGLMYRGGEGVPVDHAKAVNWYRRAAERGNPRAQTNLAISYALGRGVERDSQQALHWYLVAARQGYTDAQVRLGELYAGGLGIKPDHIHSYAWYSMALKDETTCECISGYRDEVAARMSTDEIRQAERLVKNWIK